MRERGEALGQPLFIKRGKRGATNFFVTVLRTAAWGGLEAEPNYQIFQINGIGEGNFDRKDMKRDERK
jgi:hypothetical protein